MVELSIILACYNTEKFIGKTIQSILDQSYSKWELLIINDGSTDDSLSEITKYEQKDERIKFYSIENGGVNKARNFGYKKSNVTSKFIHFMDSDDILLSNFYSNLILFLNKNQEFGAVYCDHLFIDENDKEISMQSWGSRFLPTRFWLREIDEKERETPFISIALWCKMVEPMVIIKRSVFEKSRKWDESFSYGRIGEGVVLFTEIALMSKIGYLNETMFHYRRHKNQSSQNTSNNYNSFILTNQKVFSILENKWDKIWFYSTISRYRAFSESNKIKHNLAHNKLMFVSIIFTLTYNYVLSIPLIFGLKTRYKNE